MAIASRGAAEPHPSAGAQVRWRTGSRTRICTEARSRYTGSLRGDAVRGARHRFVIPHGIGSVRTLSRGATLVTGRPAGIHEHSASTPAASKHSRCPLPARAHLPPSAGAVTGLPSSEPVPRCDPRTGGPGYAARVSGRPSDATRAKHRGGGVGAAQVEGYCNVARRGAIRQPARPENGD